LSLKTNLAINDRFALFAGLNGIDDRIIYFSDLNEKDNDTKVQIGDFGI
jgi:hypothetical protein